MKHIFCGVRILMLLVLISVKNHSLKLNKCEHCWYFDIFFIFFYMYPIFVYTLFRPLRFCIKQFKYIPTQVVDPFGRIIAQCDNSKDLDVQTIGLDPDVVENVRRSMPCFEHRRNDIYSLLPVELSSVAEKSEGDFMFQTYPIDRKTIFYESLHSVAFVNIRCVVTGRILF